MWTLRILKEPIRKHRSIGSFLFRLFNVSGSLPLSECNKREQEAFIAGYKYMRERAEEMKKYPFDEAARITASEEYWRWKGNDR